MRYIVSVLVTFICMLPLAAYGFGSAEDVRIAKNGPTVELALAKPLSSAKDVVVDKRKEVVVDKKEAVVVHDKVLEARILALEQKLKKGMKSDEQIKKLAEGVLKAKEEELNKKVDNKIIELDNKEATKDEADQKRFNAQDKKIASAVAIATDAKNNVAGLWTRLAWVIGAVVVLFVMLSIIGVLNFNRKK